ncbi:LysE family translocator [Ideonella alba]|uniref:LysE family translocator n=1 Tax=Ideonella alba TaxID=2824118 RepID=UPI0035C0E555
MDALPWTDFIALLGVVTAMAFTPGPNTMLSAALAVNRGLPAALRFCLAVPVGWCLMLLACALGLGALIQAWPALRGAITVAGLGYLLWLAGKLWRSGELGEADAARLQVGFWQGVALQFVNIKAWMAALMVVAGWVAPGAAEGFWARLAVVLPVMAAYAFASNASYALLGGLLRGWLARGARLLWFNRTMALLLLATAVWMARSA